MQCMGPAHVMLCQAVNLDRIVAYELATLLGNENRILIGAVQPFDWHSIG